MQTIQPDRLTIRTFSPEDWRDLHEMIVQYQASEYAQYDHKWPTSEEEIQGVAKWFSTGDSYLAVCLRATAKLIGLVAMNPEKPEDGPAFNLGYIFNLSYHRQGYATEACRAAIDYAFGQLGAVRMVTGTALRTCPHVAFWPDWASARWGRGCMPCHGRRGWRGARQRTTRSSSAAHGHVARGRCTDYANLRAAGSRA